MESDLNNEITKEEKLLKKLDIPPTEFINRRLQESRVYESGAKRDSDIDKSFVHSFKGYTRLRFGFRMTEGSLKYGEGNWEKGIDTKSYLESLDRHLAMYLAGDRTEDHLSAIIFNTQGVMLNEEKEGMKADHYFKN